MKRDKGEDRFPSLSDEEILEKLIHCLDEQKDMEAQLEAFSQMQAQLIKHSGSMLTRRQRKWAEDMFVKFGLDVEEGSANLISSGAVRVRPEERQKKFGFELLPRPLRPPGR